MKKHIMAIIIVLCVISLVGVGIWFFVRKNKAQPLYETCIDFAYSSNTKTLLDNITEAQNLYSQKSHSGDTRLTTLGDIVLKLDIFQKDLSSYLILSNAKPSTTNKLSKSYKSLSGTRNVLLTNLDEYITRMSGNTNISGSAINDLYNDILEDTTSYIYRYTNCIKSLNIHVFNKVYKSDNIKYEIYSLYIESVNNLLNNVSNHQFSSTSLITITRFNSNIQIVDGVVKLRETSLGGEFSNNALMFKSNFNKSNVSELVKNFETYYTVTINPTIETNAEKLTVHYLKLIMEV